MVSQLQLELSTGKILSFYLSPYKNSRFIDEYGCAVENNKNDVIDNKLKNEIFSQFNHFKNCDFRDSKCGIFNSKKEDFHRLGAIVD